MICDKKTKPKFTDALLDECKICRHASKQIRLCCKFGLELSKGKEVQYPSGIQMARNFGGSAVRHVRSGFKKRSKEEQARCRLLCEGCDDYVAESKIGPRCSRCGCCVKLAVRWATKHCPGNSKGIKLW